MTESEKTLLADGFRSISLQLSSGVWEYGYVLEGDLYEYMGFIRVWKTANYRDTPMHWNVGKVLRFKLYRPVAADYKSWVGSLEGVL